MTSPHGAIPVPDYRRIHQATDTYARGPVPALTDPAENANQRLAKTALTLNRAGSAAFNPVVAGLGVALGIPLHGTDRLTGLHVFQDRANPGQNLLGSVSLVAPGLYEYRFMAGAGPTQSGTPSTGAVKNVVRIQSKFGAYERELWVKAMDHDIVALDGQAALDPETMLHVTVPVMQLAGGKTWVPVPIDFFRSWNDEFLALHLRANPDPESGFLKAYGGAKFVSFFGAGGEGVTSPVVNVVTKQPIETAHTVEVQNTPGEKHFTVRFRSRADSAYVVDVEVAVEVIPPVPASCYTPEVEPCADVLLKKGALLPANTPAVASVPGEPTVAGTPGSTLASDLLYVMMKGYTVGVAPTMIIRRWAAQQSDTDLAGVQFIPVDGDLELIPLIVPDEIDVPSPGAPYGAGAIYCVALSVLQLKADNVAVLVAVLKDGSTYSLPMAVAGPRLRDLAFFTAPEQGGGDGCCGETKCVAGGTPTPGS